MALGTISSLLQITLVLLQTVSSHPELPPQTRDTAIVLAQTSISYARTELSGHAVESPEVSTSGVPIDVFVIAGSDNAVGFGNAAQSPKPAGDSAYQYINGSIIAAVDPVGTASSGSAWPAFATTYTQKNGTKILFVPSAMPNSSAVSNSKSVDLAWTSNGKLIRDAFNITNNALTALKAKGYTPKLSGILWSEGEYEGAAINSGTTDAAIYSEALRNTIQGFRDLFGSDLPFYILATGNAIGSDDLGYGQVRAVQNAIEDPANRIYVVSREPVPFPTTGLQKEGIHYTQAGYIDVGVAAADNVSRVQAGLETHTQKKDGLFAIHTTGERTLTFLGFLNESNSCNASEYTFWYGDGSYDALRVPQNTCGPYTFAVTHTFAPGTYSQRLDFGTASSTQYVIQGNVYRIE